MEEKKIPQGDSAPKIEYHKSYTPTGNNCDWKSENINELAESLAMAQSEMEDVARKTKGYNWKYADLHAVLGATLPYLSKNNIALIQGSNHGVGEFHITTTLMHKSGQWLRTWMKIPIQDLTGQQVGTAVTYGRRYALAAICGITQKDDDGQENSVVQSKPKEKN